MGHFRKNTRAIQSKLDVIWRENLPIILDRLDRLDSFAASVFSGKVTPQQHNDALNIAHKLAGSLGIFGFAAASALAHKLELLLRSPDPLDAPQLQRLCASLRNSLQL